MLSPEDLASAGSGEAWTDPWPVPDPGVPPPLEPVERFRVRTETEPRHHSDRPRIPAGRPAERVVAPIGGPVLPISTVS